MDDQVLRLDDDKSRVAVQDNELIRSAYTMTLVEKRLLLHAISKIDSHALPKSGQSIQVEVTAKQWKQLYNTAQPWRDLKNASRKLMNRQVTIYPTKKKTLIMNWIDSTEYTSDTVKIRFGYHLSKYLTGILSQFTQIDLLDVAKFDSVYTVRLYELLRQVEKAPGEPGWLKISVEEFRTVFDLGDKYDRFSYLNQRVLTPAVKELNRKSDWEISLDRIKKGRAVHMLHFKFEPRKQQDLFDETSEPKAQAAGDKSSKRAAISASVMDVTNTDW